MGLQSLENGLGRIVDGVFNRAFKNSVRPIEIGRRLIREIDVQRSVNSQGQRVVPNHFSVLLSTADYEALRPYIDPLVTELVHAVEQYCADEGYTLRSGVSVDIIEDAQAPRRKIAIASDCASREPAPVAERPAPPMTPPTLVHDAVASAPLPTLSSFLVISDGRAVTLGDSPVVIGRLSECDITIEDPNISRRHATVTVLDGTYRITDLGSTNGTKVNGTRISSQHELAHGDEITVGLFSIRFEIG
ncbi:MAG: FhaA domain-containing protein [Actinomycetota bacterium]